MLQYVQTEAPFGRGEGGGGRKVSGKVTPAEADCRPALGLGRADGQSREGRTLRLWKNNGGRRSLARAFVSHVTSCGACARQRGWLRSRNNATGSRRADGSVQPGNLGREYEQKSRRGRLDHSHQQTFGRENPIAPLLSKPHDPRQANENTAGGRGVLPFCRRTLRNDRCQHRVAGTTPLSPLLPQNSQPNQSETRHGYPLTFLQATTLPGPKVPV
ncbi:hypothetical protein SKAU_G00300460 [Synaphobranchus kaupii]|uniref:Uncharacterized protein n=1 Tax=Synaphobranchus kaupii TaxID=118154 RepID=A0A9Q1IN72_SYNKA|nr:hypothetical protein SKAU_G00300460 [Synaphobranchus kaupii]